MKIQVTKPAQQDLTDLESYIRRDHPKVARRLVQRILEAIEGLEMFPNLGRTGCCMVLCVGLQPGSNKL